MQNHPSPLHLRLPLALVLALVLAGGHASTAATPGWTGALGTDFELPGNWDAGVPANNTSSDQAIFGAVVTANQPSLSMNRSINGLIFQSATGGWTLGGGTGFTLTVGGGGIDDTANTGGTTIIDANVTMNTSENWSSGNGGTLQINGTLTSSGGNRTLTVDSGTVTVASINTDTTGRTFAKNGAGTLVVQGAAGANLQNTFTVSAGTAFLEAANATGSGLFTVSGTGTAILGHNAATGAGNINLSGGTLQASVDLGGANAIANHVILGNSSTISGANNITLDGSFTNSGSNRSLASSLDSGKTLELAGNVFLSEATGTGRTLTLSGTGETLVSGVVADFDGAGQPGNLTISNTNRVVLAANNQHTGITSIGGNGVLQITSVGNLGPGEFRFAPGSVSNVATLELRADGDTSFAKDANPSSNVVGVMRLDVDRATAGGPAGGTHTWGNGGNITMNGDNGGLLVTGDNGYNLVFNQALTWGGQNQTQVPNIYSNASGLLTLQGNVVRSTVNNRAFEIGGSGDILLAGTLTLSGAHIYKTGSGTLTLANATSASGGTVVNGGTVFLAPTATFPGGQITVMHGTFDLNGIGGTGGALTMGGGPPGTTSLLATGASTVVLGGNVTYNGHLDNDAGGLVTGNLDLGGATRRFYINDSSAGDLTIAANLSGGSSSNVIKEYAGTLVLSGANSYAGTTTVTGGVLRLASANALPGGIGPTGGTANLNLNGGVVELAAGDFSRPLGTAAQQVQIGANGGGFSAHGANRTVNLGGAGATLNFGGGSGWNASGQLSLTAATATHTVDFQNPLALGNAARTVEVRDGAAAVDAILSGALTSTTGGGLVKTGDGWLRLTGANPYNGATQIVAGTLEVAPAGTLAGTSAVTIAGGAELRYNSATPLAATVAMTIDGTIGGSGAILAPVSIGANATVSPGNSPGSQSYAEMAWAPGGTYLWEINDLAGSAGADPGWDLLLVGTLDIGTLTALDKFAIDLVALPGLGDGPARGSSQSWTIVDYDTLLGTFAAEQFELSPTGFADPSWSTVTWRLVDTGSELVLQAFQIPEPTTAMLMLALAGLIGRRRRPPLAH